MVERTNLCDLDASRLVYTFKRVIDVEDVKVTALDAHDPIVVLGNNKGYIWPWIKANTGKHNVSAICAINPDKESFRSSTNKIWRRQNTAHLRLIPSST